MSKLYKDKEMFEKKLSNKKFVENAPESVIEETKKKLEDVNDQIGRLEKIIKELE